MLVVVVLLAVIYYEGFLRPRPGTTPPPFVTDPRDVVPELNASESTHEQFTGVLHVDNIAASTLTVQGSLYHKLDILGSGHSSEQGKPDIPFLVYYFVLPRDGQGKAPAPVAELQARDVVDYTGIKVFPAQPLKPDNVGSEFPPFTIDEQAYLSKSPYPDKLYETKLARVGDVDLLMLRVFPVQYIAGDRLVQLRRTIDIDLDFNPQNVTVSPAALINDARYAPAIPRPENEETFEAMPVTVVGYPTQVFDDPMYSLLIITHQNFYSAAYRLAQHKSGLGWKVKLVTPTDFQPGGYYNPTLDEAIRNFVRDEWDKNSLISTRTDPNEPAITDDKDLMGINFVRKHDEFYVDVFLYQALTLSPMIYVHVDLDGDGVADRTINIWWQKFEVRQGTTLLLNGTASVRGTTVSVHFPWLSAFPASAPNARVWAVCELNDRIPDEGNAPLNWEGGLHTLRNLLLVGDADRIRPNIGINEGVAVLTAANPKALSVGTDLYYSIVQDKEDCYPDIAVGRIPVDTLAEADAVVDKIIAYETTSAPVAFSKTFAVSGGFYDVQGFKPTTQPRGTLDGFAVFTQDSRDVAGVGSRFREDVNAGDWIRTWGAGGDFSQVSSVADDTHLTLVDPWDRPNANDRFEVWRADGRDNAVFIKTAERVRSYLVHNMGYAADVYYTVDWEQVNPQRLADGSELPDELKRPSYDWDASVPDIINEMNSGENLFILHRDHGEFFGWGTPGVKAGDIVAGAHSASALLPLVLSINCASGYFDNEYDYWRIRQPDGTVLQTPATPANGADWSDDTYVNFAEALLRQPDGGAIGVIAPTRLSYSGNNDVFTDGIFSYMYSGYVGIERGTTYVGSSTTLGSILQYAKMYAGSRIDGDDWIRYYMEIFHVIGDPTLQVKYTA